MEQNANVLGAGLFGLDRDALSALVQSLCAQLTARGAYHGGIRPENISSDGQGGFSLGEGAGNDLTREWTPAELEFMAPEVFWNGTRTPSADVYSLGMLLYAGVTGGQLPFYPANATDADRDDALRRRMSGEALPMPKTAGRPLAQVIEKATQFRLDERYESPQALSEALEDARQAMRSYAAPAREMFDRPVQELSETERMLLGILNEKAETARRAEAEAKAAEEAARAEAERETASLFEAMASGARKREALENPPEPEPEEAPAEPAAEEPPAEPEPEKPKPVKKPGVDPALVEAISASVAARMAEPAKPVKSTPTVPDDLHREEAERITRQLEQMDWIGHKNGGKDRHNGWIVALLAIIALVLGALILHSIGAISGRPRIPVQPEETPMETAEVLAPVDSAEPVESAEPTPTPTPTPTPAAEPTFEVVLSDVSWEQAKAEAEARGGHLAVIRSAEDLQKIAALAAEKGARYVWIGLHRTDSGELQWLAENATPYVSWAPGEPSVRDAYTGQPENYVLIANQAGTWTFNDCGNDPAGAYPRFYSGQLAYAIEFDS